MVLPIAIPPVPEAAIATYDYTDIAEGTGIVKFNALVSITGGESPTDDEHLTRDATIYSGRIESVSVTLAGNEVATLLYTKNFDLAAFNLPKTIKGTGYFNCGCYMTQSAGGPFGFVVIRLKKNAVEIATATSSSMAEGVKIMGMPFSVSTPVHFKKGDVLRLTVELWGDTTAGAPSITAFQIGHDPLNRDGTNIKPSVDDIITKMILWVPFRIDL